jgi:multidrug efflux pump
LTVSLIAVLIPLLFMGDVAGRLFRQFAVTLAVTIILSAFVSLTLTPMMSARLLRYTPPSEEGKFYRYSERVFDSIIAFYGRTLRFVLGYQTIMLIIFAITLVLTVVLYISIPKGFFPTQDTGIIQGITQAPASISFTAMAQKQQAIANEILKDPAVDSLSSFIGADGTNTTLNSGRIQVNLKTLGSGKGERNDSAMYVIDRLNQRLNNVEGIKLYMQPVQDLTVDDRVSRTQYQYTLEDPNQVELNTVTADFVKRLKALPQLADVVTDQQLGGVAASLTIDRATASRFGITPSTIDNTLYDAFGQRQINTMYTQLNQYHVIMEAVPNFQRDPNMLNRIYVQSSSTSASSASTASNTAGSSSGAGSGSAASTGNAFLTPSQTTGVSAASSSTSALTSSANANGLAATSQVSSTGALSQQSSSGSNSTVLSTSASAANISSSTNTSTGGTTRTGSGSTTAPGAAGGGGGGGGGAGSNPALPTPIPLGAFTHFETASEALSIDHQGQFPAVTVSFNLATGYSLGQALDAIDKAIEKANFPASIVSNYQGTAAAFEGSLSNEGLLILAALVVVYIVLGVLYESFVHPITILSTLPSAGVGALLALELFHLDLDIVAIIGIILLIGIVKKNGIMMVDFALEAERKEGKTATEAIYQASLLRLRPILMTTMAALLSGVPLAFGSGIGSELRKPLGVAMVGGLLFSQVLTLYTTPVIYIFFDNLGERLSKNGRKKLKAEKEEHMHQAEAV